MNQSKKNKIEDITKTLLEEIGEDPSRKGLERTPKRVAKAWQFLAKGYEQNLEDIINNAIFYEDYDEMVTIRDIDFFSLCEHHLLPFFGKAHIAYIPKGKVIGLSKIPRIVEMFGRRLQIQERMTQQIAEAVNKVVAPNGVAVILEGEHMCMQMRGVQKRNSYASTSFMTGVFREDSRTRQEFLTLINHRKDK